MNFWKKVRFEPATSRILRKRYTTWAISDVPIYHLIVIGEQLDVYSSGTNYPALNHLVTWHLSCVSKTNPYQAHITTNGSLVTGGVGEKTSKIGGGGGGLHTTSFTTIFSSPNEMHRACS